MTVKKPTRSVIAIQQGARRNYEYARQLDNKGRLKYLLTDVAWVEKTPFLLRESINFAKPTLSSAIQRRTIYGIDASRVRTTVFPAVARALCKVASIHEERAFEYANAALSLHNMCLDFRNVAAVVNYHGDGGSLLARARAAGANILTDFVSTPFYLDIESSERKKWPGWEVDTTTNSIKKLHLARIRKLLKESDYYLCPSKIVKEHLRTLPEYQDEKARIVPYGSGNIEIPPRRTIPGRVLFAGSARLIKGIAYLGLAAQRLKRIAPSIEVVVAGPVAEPIAKMPEMASITFLGKLSAADLAQEYAKADIYCHPSLCEGSPSSIFEALAHGLPIVTTDASGSVITDGNEGFITEERNVSDIVSALMRIFSDRSLRAAMASAAGTTADLYTPAACGVRFIDVIDEAEQLRQARITR